MIRALRTTWRFLTAFREAPINRERRLSELAARRERLRRSRKRVADIDREACRITTQRLRKELRA